ncbi:hypothetical protein O6H91_02G036700 [Diphasiastrum complanatum]|uniref:Uncharacterized protein n=1 Tax=Diphasiastrum complanatum TaxID=34168 RepID=A0ACC2EEE0_DIPCM|nr:hypothetical protein O6H91_02G036700 [Diphasiastrum complanatum]
MPLNRGIDNNCVVLLKPRIDLFGSICPCYFRYIRWLSLFLAICVLCRRATASDQHLVAGLEPVASAICPCPTLTDLLLPWNDALEPFREKVLLDRDPELSDENIAVPSRVVELNETTLEQALALLRSSNGTSMMVLFYADWCPFSKELRPTYDVLSSLFPSIYHVAVEGTTLRPSVLSKYGVHSFPLLFLHDKASRERYHGSRKLEDLVIFLENTTGLKPLAKGHFAGREIGSLSDFVKETDGSRELCPFPRGLSPGKWLHDDTYLMLATWFLILRILLPVLPWASSRLKRFWNRCHVYLFARLRFSDLFKEKPGRRTFSVEIADLKSRDFARRWSKPLLS